MIRYLLTVLLALLSACSPFGPSGHDRNTDPPECISGPPTDQCQ